MRTWNKDIINKVDKEVELMGWVAVRRDHGKIIFIDLRDKTGINQLVFIPVKSEQSSDKNNVYEKANTLRPEWVIKIRGEVKKRPKGMENNNLKTGEYEIEVKDLEILNEAKTPPFSLDTDGYDINEETRMAYRYLDLRRQRLQKNLKARFQIIKFIRDYLTEKEFTEIETPIITKSTPEGARDYIIPARLQPGKFYALPQSPQQYKQLLMVAGTERYFQIARCFRDEDTRGDRQPEFTQLDIEMSFITQEEIMELIEEMFLNLVKKLYPEKKIKLASDGRIIRMSYKDAMEKYGSDKPDIRDNKDDKNELAFLFVVDFPMFEWKENEKRWDAAHHPFTQPKVKDAIEFQKLFKENPAKILAEQYDFVLNGFEVGGGSIRIHNSELLQAVFEAMGNKAKDIQEKFGHLLEAFNYGVPPHGGIAPGIDRLIMILENEPNIREVIAFPKTGDGRDLMMNAPSEIDKEQLKDLGLEIKNKE
ncbi:aspartate--tRNA ligase [Candidatus Wolfebacteria bacterium]|nr:aspartate--tRNA ligase [Candidatus Wolfebacteria bacterium]